MYLRVLEERGGGREGEEGGGKERAKEGRGREGRRGEGGTVVRDMVSLHNCTTVKYHTVPMHSGMWLSMALTLPF